MSNFDYETVAFVDPHSIRMESVLFDIDDDEMCERKEVLAKQSRDRDRKGLYSKKIEALRFPHGIDLFDTYVTHVACANDVIVLATKNGLLNFYDQTDTIPSSTLPIGHSHSDASHTAISKLFLDPLGRHLIVALASGSNFYVHLKAGANPTRHDMKFHLDSSTTKDDMFEIPITDDKRASTTTKFAVESVAWDPNNVYEAASGTVLLGAKAGGMIISARFDHSGMAAARCAFTFPAQQKLAAAPAARSTSSSSTSSKSQTIPVTGLAIDKESGTGSHRRCVVLAAMQNRLYYFLGYGAHETVFDNYSNYTADALQNYVVIGSDTVTPTTSTLNYLQLSHLPIDGFPSAYTWYCGGVLVQGLIKQIDHTDLPYEVKVDLNQGNDKRRARSRSFLKTYAEEEEPTTTFVFPCILNKHTEVFLPRLMLEKTALAKKDDSMKSPSQSQRELLMTAAKGAAILGICATPYYLVVTTEDRVAFMGLPPSIPWRSCTDPPSEIGTVDAQNRVFFEFPLCKVRPDDSKTYLYKKDGAAGGVLDPQKRKFYVYHSAEIFEVELPNFRYVLTPLFLDTARTANDSDPASEPKKTVVPTIAPRDQPVCSITPILAARHYFEAARKTAGKSRCMQVKVSDAEAEFLWHQQHFVEAAKKMAELSSRGIDELVVRLANLPTTMPLQVFITEILAKFAEKRSIAFDAYAVEMRCLATFLVQLLIDQCNREAPAEPFRPVTDSENPELLDDLDEKTRAKYKKLYVPHYYNTSAEAPPKAEVALEGDATTTTLQDSFTSGSKNLSFEQQAAATFAADSKRPASFAATIAATTMKLESVGNEQPGQSRLEKLLGDYREEVQWNLIARGLLYIGNEPQIVYLCRSLEKLHEVLENYILHKRFADAADLLINDCKESPAFLPLWLKYSYVLVRNVPRRMIGLGWIPCGQDIGLLATHMLPAIARYSTAYNEPIESEAPNPILQAADERFGGHMGMAFLSHVIEEEGEIDHAVHNLLVDLLASQGSDEELLKLVRSSSYYDKYYAVRMCAKNLRFRVIAELYFLLHEISDSIDLALSLPDGEGGVQVAKEITKSITADAIADEGFEYEADRVEAALKMRIGMWRRILAFVASGDGGSRNALLLLAESNNDVNVSDVLPLLSDDVMICEFKNELLSNVKNFESMLGQVDQSIDVVATCSVELHNDLTSQQRATETYSASKKCEACGQQALTREAILFRGCGHAFHRNCWESEMRSRLGRTPTDDDMECYLCAVKFICQFLRAPLSSETAGIPSIHLSS